MAITDVQRYFERRYVYHPRRRRVWKAVCEYLQPWVPAGAAVLDLGAGYCDFINQIAAGEKYALDAHGRVAEFCAPGVRFLHADVTEIALPARSLDITFASNVLEHLTDEQLDGLFEQLERVLRPSGRLILVQPNYYYCYRRYWDDFTHVKAYTHESLADLLVCRHYAIRRLERRFLPLSMNQALPHSYWLTRLYLALPWRPRAGQMLIVAQRDARV